jgi:hypothetical protein
VECDYGSWIGMRGGGLGLRRLTILHLYVPDTNVTFVTAASVFVKMFTGERSSSSPEV